MAKALMLLAADLDHELSKGSPEVFVVRSLDWFRSPHENVVKPRMQAEGVLLAVARRTVQIVESHSGRELGDICGVTKAALEADAALHGFAPRRVGHGRRTDLVLEVCPFADIAVDDPPTVCALHRGLAEGLVAAVGGARVEAFVARDPYQAGCRIGVRRTT